MTEIDYVTLKTNLGRDFSHGLINDKVTVSIIFLRESFREESLDRPIARPWLSFGICLPLADAISGNLRDIAEGLTVFFGHLYIKHVDSADATVLFRVASLPLPLH